MLDINSMFLKSRSRWQEFSEINKMEIKAFYNLQEGTHKQNKCSLEHLLELLVLSFSIKGTMETLIFSLMQTKI
jgi:hypothetical protein